MKNLAKKLPFKIFVAFSFALLFLSNQSSAQDVITLNDGTKINANIVEMGETTVKYKPYGSKKDRVISIDRSIVKKIKLEEGVADVLDPEKISENYYFNDRRSNLKVGFLSIFRNGLSVAYEQALSPRDAIEIVMRIQGIGYTAVLNNNKGFGVGIAYRANLSSSAKKSARNAHILADYYMKPEFSINFTEYGRDFSSAFKNSTNAGLVLNFGREWVLNNRISLDVFLGLGFGLTLNKTRNPNVNCPDCIFGEVTSAGGELFSPDGKTYISSGFRLGYLFNTPTKEASKKL